MYEDFKDIPCNNKAASNSMYCKRHVNYKIPYKLIYGDHMLDEVIILQKVPPHDDWIDTTYGSSCFSKEIPVYHKASSLKVEPNVTSISSTLKKPKINTLQTMYIFIEYNSKIYMERILHKREELFSLNETIIFT